jgi:hypothetical protein
MRFVVFPVKKTKRQSRLFSRRTQQNTKEEKHEKGLGDSLGLEEICGADEVQEPT